MGKIGRAEKVRVLLILTDPQQSIYPIIHGTILEKGYKGMKNNCSRKGDLALLPCQLYQAGYGMLSARVGRKAISYQYPSVKFQIGVRHEF